MSRGEALGGKVEPPRTRTAGGVWQSAFLSPRTVANVAIPEEPRPNRLTYIQSRQAFRPHRRTSVSRVRGDPNEPRRLERSSRLARNHQPQPIYTKTSEGQTPRGHFPFFRESRACDWGARYLELDTLHKKSNQTKAKFVQLARSRNPGATCTNQPPKFCAKFFQKTIDFYP